ncbi:MAG: hypothetical protein KF915_22030 [Polyangiaceae bacterium]|nr:hypothetical protein [Polyangiaceae bacterium]
MKGSAREVRAARSGAWLLVASALMGWSGAAEAQASGATLEARSTSARPVKVDGWLKEWGGFTPLSVAVKGSAPSTVSASVSVGYDARQLYLAFTVKDDDLVRTSAFGSQEDRLELSLSVPKPEGGAASYELWLYPGVPGKSAGAVKFRDGSRVAGAKIVEADAKGGVDVEVSVPWSALPATQRLRVGLKGAARYVDYAAGGKQRAIIGTSAETQASRLPPLRFENERALEGGLLEPKRLSRTPSKVVYANVAGDAALEQIAVYGGFLTIIGSGYRNGEQFFFKDLSVGSRGVERLEAQDLTGDGRAEIITVSRVGEGDSYRELVQVLSLSAEGVPFVAFEHEIAVRTPVGSIANRMSIGRHAGKPAVIIAQGEASGFDQASYSEPRQAEALNAILPWEPVAERSFAWDGKRFVQVAEKAGKPRLTEGSGTKAPAAKSPSHEPPAPRPPTADELLDQVYALYRERRGVAKEQPRFDFVTDVSGDTTRERVLVHGLDVVVFGKGYRGGTSFAYITLPAKAPEDVLHVTARDLTGDGKAEIIARAKLKTQTSEEFGKVVVERHALLVYQVGESALVRVFAAEVGRVLGDRQVRGRVLFKPAERGVTLVLKPGRVTGWTEQTYPFPVETTTSGGLEPLLLPWSAERELSYQFTDGAFQRR